MKGLSTPPVAGKIMPFVNTSVVYCLVSHYVQWHPQSQFKFPGGKGAVAWSGWGSFGHCSHVVNINKYFFNCFEILIGEIYIVVLSKLPCPS